MTIVVMYIAIVYLYSLLQSCPLSCTSITIAIAMKSAAQSVVVMNFHLWSMELCINAPITREKFHVRGVIPIAPADSGIWTTYILLPTKPLLGCIGPDCGLDYWSYCSQIQCIWIGYPHAAEVNHV